MMWLPFGTGRYSVTNNGTLYEAKKLGRNRWAAFYTKPGMAHSERCFDTDCKTEGAAVVACQEHQDQGELI